ncbi:MAG: hypothetical protein AB8E82_13435 [Aureispira sp.]
MKPILSFYLFFHLFLVSCQNSPSTPNTPAAPTVPQTNQQKIYYLQLVHASDDATQKEILRLFQQQLFGHGYTLKEGTIQKINQAEQSTGMPLHQFQDIASYQTSNTSAEKIILTIKIPKEEQTFDFHYQSYKKLGHQEWQSVFNPGFFNYPSEQPFEVDKVANWLTERVVLLTFK